MDRSSNLGPGTRFYRLQTCLDRIWGPPRLHFNGYQGYPPGIKLKEHDVYHSPPSSAKVEFEWSYTSAFHPYLHGVYGTIFLLSFTPQLARRGSGKRRKTSVRTVVIWPNFETKPHLEYKFIPTSNGCVEKNMSPPLRSDVSFVWPLVPKFAGSKPAEAVGFLRVNKNPQHVGGHGCLSVVTVVCCQVEVSATN